MSRSEDELRSIAASVGADGYLPKSLPPEAMLARIAEDTGLLQ